MTNISPLILVEGKLIKKNCEMLKAMIGKIIAAQLLIYSLKYVIRSQIF